MHTLRHVKPGLIILAFFFTTPVVAQFNIRPELCAGFGLNPGLTLNSAAVVHPNAFVCEGGLLFELLLLRSKKFGISTGMSAHYVRNAGQIQHSVFVAHTWRAVIPLLIGYTQNRWKINVGCSVQNNRDFNDIDPEQLFNYRINAQLRIDYRLASRILAGARYSQSLSQVGNSFFVVDPQYSFMAGLSFALNRPVEK
jgi:hypothetical protein